MALTTKSITIVVEDIATLGHAATILAANGIKALATNATVPSNQEELKFQVTVKGTSCRAFLKTMGNDHEGVLRGTAEAVFFTSPGSADLYLFEVIRERGRWSTVLLATSDYNYDN